MFDSVDEWLATARPKMARYAAALRHIDELQAEAAVLLAEAVEAYEWPENLPLPDRMDTCRQSEINGRVYSEDLTSELAVAAGTSVGAAQYLVGQVADLNQHLPACWSKVVNGQAPLWQARRVADACRGLAAAAWTQVDAAVAPCLGSVSQLRLSNLVTAAIAAADPYFLERRARSARCVKTGADKHDPLTGWLWGKLDRADAESFEAMLQLVADTLEALGDHSDEDQRRARAVGILANPAEAIQLLTTSPDPDDPVQTRKLVRQLSPRTRLHIHAYVDNLDNPDAVARVEGIGPVLLGQITQLTRASRVTVVPVVHVGAHSVTADAYEIPTAIREQVLMRDPYECFPWSSRESRSLELDHTIPYQPGLPGQTRPSNLGPLTRKAHRIKTHVGWRLEQPSPGVFIWRTPAQQRIQVDYTGTHRLPAEDRTTPTRE